MIKRVVSAVLVSSILATGICMNMGTVQAKADDARRVLIWSDEFEGDEIDSEKWSATSNIYLENGSVVLPSSYQQDTGEWSVAWFTTRGRFGFRYGRLEARIKMTAYPGEFPAFWTMGYNKQSKDATDDIDGCRWSKCGEIDIMEEFSPNGSTATPGAGLHWCNDWLQRNQSVGIGRLGNFDTTQWHIYAMEWDEQGIEIFYDDTSVGYVDYNELDYYKDMNPFHMPQHILFDNLINDPTVANTQLTSKMWIDWVRVYAPETETKVITESAISLEEAGTRKAIKNGKMAVGDSAYMNVVFVPESVVNQSYQIVSSNEAVASVNGGVITAKSPGTTRITAISPNGKTCDMELEVYLDVAKYDLSNVKLENTDLLLQQEKTWFWGENSRDWDITTQKIHTSLIKVSPNTTYEIAVANECLSAGINVIEYRADGSYIKWADYKDGILKTGKDAEYIRINLKMSKSGMTMNYSDYLEYLKYSTFVITKNS